MLEEILELEASGEWTPAMKRAEVAAKAKTDLAAESLRGRIAEADAVFQEADTVRDYPPHALHDVVLLAGPHARLVVSH